MMEQMNKLKLPKSALTLYVKMYCKRKDKPKSKYYNNLVEATKSWLSLSNDEKQKFYAKHKENQSKLRKILANYLKNAEPYMKTKEILRTPDSRAADAEKGSKTEKLQSEAEFQEDINLNTTNNIADNSETAAQLDTECQEGVNLNTDNLEPSAPWETNPVTSEPQVSLPLPEPTPPIIKTAKELFEVVKSKDERNDSLWVSLPRIEKKRYQRAVLSVKKEYIKRYKAYLESLPSNELFNHYNKVT